MDTSNLLEDFYTVIKSDFFNESPISAFIWNNNEQWSVKAVSKNINVLLGYDKKDFISGKLVYSNLIHPDDLERVTSEVKTNSNAMKKSFAHKPYRIKNSENKYIWVKDKTTILYKDNVITHYVGYISDCTNEIQLINEVESSRNMWTNAIESNGDGLWEWNIITNEVFFSTQWKKMLGFEENEVTANIEEWEKRVHPDDLKKVTKEIEDYLEGKTERYISEHRVQCKDGTYKWILDRGAITKYTPDGQIELITGTHSDITDKYKSQNEIEQLKLRFENMFHSNNAMMLLIDPENENIIDANKQALSFYGYSYEEMLNLSIYDINQLTKEEIVKIRTEFLEGTYHRFEVPHKLKNGDIKMVEIHSSPIETDIGTILFSIIENIDDKINLEKKLSKSLSYNRTLIDNLPMLIWLKDIDSNLLAVNKPYAKATGLEDPKFLIGKNDFDIWPKELASNYLKDDKEVLINGKTKLLVEEIMVNNKKKLFETFKSPVYNKNKKLLGTIGYAMDISEKIAIEELLEQQYKELEIQKEEFETIFNSSKDGIAIVDLESNFLNCNESYCSMLNYTKKEMLATSCLEVGHAQDKERSIEALKEVIEKGEIRNFEKSCITKDKRQIYVNMSGSLLPDKKRILFVTKDVSDIRLLNEQSKLASMGEMIGNIAHQWRQPLSVISSASTGLILHQHTGLIEEDYLKKSMNQINEQAQYLSKTIDDFTNFIKNDRVDELMKIIDSINYALHLTEATIKNNYINIVTEFKDDMQIHGNKNEVVQCLINILNNSKDALKENTKESDRYIFISTQKFKNKLELKICDSGGGIPSKYLERIFEPYFSTKHQSIGTGIGLSMVNKILIEKYKASIDVYNDEMIYKGKHLNRACFKIIFQDI